MEEIHIIYVKELTDICEIFREDSKLPMWLKQVILLLKKMFCVLTIKENGVCVLPYREVKHFFKIKLWFLKRVFARIGLPMLLSQYLSSITEVNEFFASCKLVLITGEGIANYLLPEVLQYIAKMLGEEIQKQEVTVLVEKKTIEIEKMILELATKVKRIQIVTPNLSQFNRLENELETKFGIACTISNNKRKSLAKSKIIININASETYVNQFNLNPYAIVIDMNQKIKIYTKTFCGIHIYDYQMKVDNVNLAENLFETKKQYEAKLLGNSYEIIRNQVEKENVRITNLVGQKGLICREEFKRVLQSEQKSPTISQKTLDKSLELS